MKSYTDTETIEKELQWYKRVFLNVKNPFHAIHLQGRECLISVGSEKIPLIKLLPEGVCLFSENYHPNKARIVAGYEFQKLVQKHITFYKFMSAHEFVQSIEKSWWSGDFFFTTEALYDDVIKNKEAHPFGSVWEVTRLTLRHIEKYRLLYSVWEYDEEVIFLAPSESVAVSPVCAAQAE